MSTRFNSVSSNGREALTLGQIYSVAPSVFAKTAHESRSQRFSPIPTINVVEGMLAHGFQPTYAAQTRTKDVTKREFTKHMIRFRHTKDLNLGLGHSVGDYIPEIVLVNANDGTSSYILDAGVFRIACLNGLIVASAEFGAMHVRHSGNVVDKVIEGAYTIVNDYAQVAKSVDAFKSIVLDPREQAAFAESARALRYPEVEDGNYPVEVGSFLKVRRLADGGNDLWTVFNRVQENIMQGGMTYRTANNRLTSTRRVNSVNANVALNKALWTLADKMAELKKGGSVEALTV